MYGNLLYVVMISYLELRSAKLSKVANRNGNPSENEFYNKYKYTE